VDLSDADLKTGGVIELHENGAESDDWVGSIIWHGAAGTTADALNPLRGFECRRAAIVG